MGELVNKKGSTARQTQLFTYSSPNSLLCDLMNTISNIIASSPSTCGSNQSECDANLLKVATTREDVLKIWVNLGSIDLHFTVFGKSLIFSNKNTSVVRIMIRILEDWKADRSRIGVYK